MNRTIKFRAWARYENKMFQVKYLEIEGEKYYVSDNKIIKLEVSSEACSELMQYTDLKDKNGREIYMEDIVKFRFYDKDDKYSYFGGTAKITYNLSEGVGLLFDYEDKIESEAYAVTEGGVLESYWPDTDLWEIEVIGNIYENPELLK